MGDNSGIEWTDATWNPIRARNRITGQVGWFCEHVSRECDFCYAEKQNVNTFFGNGLPYKSSSLPQLELFLDEEMLTRPLRWRRPRHIFVCSMTDLFGRFVNGEWIDRIFEVMHAAKQHTFQVLTKRPERMYDHVSRSAWLSNDPLPNVWLGVSAGDQSAAEKRVPLLLQTPAAVRFVSAEPLLGPVDLSIYLASGYVEPPHTDVVDWVIAGGESGPSARPMHPDWARKIRDDCGDYGRAFFFKQWGEWRPIFEGEDGPACAVCGCTDDSPCVGGCEWSNRNLDMRDVCTNCDRVTIQRFGRDDFARVGKKRAGAELDGREWKQMPEVRAHD